MNSGFLNVQVPFTNEVVKSKIAKLQSKWVSGCLGIDCPPVVANFLFGAIPSASEPATADSGNLNSEGNMNNVRNANNRGNVAVDNASIVGVLESMQLPRIQIVDATEMMTNAPLSQKETFIAFTDNKLRIIWLKRRMNIPLSADEVAAVDEVAHA